VQIPDRSMYCVMYIKIVFFVTYALVERTGTFFMLQTKFCKSQIKACSLQASIKAWFHVKIKLQQTKF